MGTALPRVNHALPGFHVTFPGVQAGRSPDKDTHARGMVHLGPQPSARSALDASCSPESLDREPKRGKGPDLQHTRPLGLRLLRVHGGAAQARDLLHGLAQQVGAQPAAHEHQHWRLEELLVLKNQRRTFKTRLGRNLQGEVLLQAGRRPAVHRPISTAEDEKGTFGSDGGFLQTRRKRAGLPPLALPPRSVTLTKTIRSFKIPPTGQRDPRCPVLLPGDRAACIAHAADLDIVRKSTSQERIAKKRLIPP